MEFKNQTYYWVLPLNEGKWKLARHIEGSWFLTDTRAMMTDDLGQIGEEIPENDILFERRRKHNELISLTQKMQDMIINLEAKSKTTKEEDEEILSIVKKAIGF